MSNTVRTSPTCRGNVGAVVRVAASMNLSRVRSLACTSVLSRPCTDAKLGRSAPAFRCASMSSASSCGSVAGLNCRLNPRTDGASNRWRTVRWALRLMLIVAMSRMAVSESPPRLKKESSMLTRGSPRMWV